MPIAAESQALAKENAMLKPDEELAYQLYKDATRTTLKIQDPKIGTYTPWENLPSAYRNSTSPKPT